MSFGRSISVSQIPRPAGDSHAVPPRPRPAHCASARTSVPAGAPAVREFVRERPWSMAPRPARPPRAAPASRASEFRRHPVVRHRAPPPHQARAASVARITAPRTQRYSAKTPKLCRETNRSSTAIASPAARRRRRRCRRGSWWRRCLGANASGTFSTAAASVIGKLIRKLNTAAALARSKPSSAPPVIVEPDRDTPGTSARHWAKPIEQRVAPRHLVERPIATRDRSTAQSTTPITISAIAMSSGERNTVSAWSSSSKPGDRRRNRADDEEHQPPLLRRAHARAADDRRSPSRDERDPLPPEVPEPPRPASRRAARRRTPGRDPASQRPTA